MGTAQQQTRPPALELRGISKRFGAVQANKNINFCIEKGTIHGIVGENGAGKSTLMSIIYGFYQADSGEVWVNGQPVTIRSSQDAIALGIGMVHQHFMLIEPFSVLENVMLGVEGGEVLTAGRKQARIELQRLAKEYALDVDPDAMVGELPVGLQQRVEILKALYRRAEILILDEPTGVLTPEEADHLFRILDQLRQEGKTIILITHKLREIMAITDNISVIRRGEVVANLATRAATVEKLAELMVGRRVLLQVDKGEAAPGAVKLAINKARYVDRFGVERLRSVSLQVRAGEIVGIAGVVGNGQSELLEVIAGIRPLTSGEILLNGKDIKGASPGVLRSLRLAHIPEDRQRMGLVSRFEARENSILGYHDRPAFNRRFLMKRGAILQAARSMMEKYDVRPLNMFLQASKFSGGNQQKMVIGREIERNPDVLIIGQPTRGVDVGAIEAIHRRIIELRDAGKAILLVSVELDEIRSLSDRILVMFDGRITGERDPSVSEGELGLLMSGVTDLTTEVAA